SIVPHVGVGGGTPAPRYDNVASNSTVAAIPSDAYTIRIGRTCGSRWSRKIRSPRLPSARDASTNSLFRRTSVRLYTIRAVAVHSVVPMMIVTRPMLGPSTYAIVIVRSRTGNESHRSVDR